MKIQEYKIASENKDKIYTEILFHIASCRAGGEEFAFISLSENDVALPVEKYLKGLKQGGKIDFYIKSDELTSTTIGSYIENKYPEITKAFGERTGLYIVKL